MSYTDEPYTDEEIDGVLRNFRSSHPKPITDIITQLRRERDEARLERDQARESKDNLKRLTEHQETCLKKQAEEYYAKRREEKSTALKAVRERIRTVRELRERLEGKLHATSGGYECLCGNCCGLRTSIQEIDAYERDLVARIEAMRQAAGVVERGEG